MMTRLAAILAAILALTCCAAVPARAAAPDPISTAMNACLAKAANTTAGMLTCTNKAYAGWDQRLNEVYQNLMKALDPASRKLLLTAQRGWLAYRNEDARFAGGPWRAKTGRLAEVTIALSRLDQLRSRVRVLETYANALGITAVAVAPGASP